MQIKLKADRYQLAINLNDISRYYHSEITTCLMTTQIES